MTGVARRLREAVAARASVTEWDGGVVAANFADLRASGLPGLSVPRTLGGPGGSIGDASAAVREVAAGDAATGLVLAMHYIHTTRLFAQPDLLTSAHEKLAARILATGELVALAASEQVSGAPSRGAPIRTTARREATGGWVLDGSKTYATGASVVGTIVVVATFAKRPGKGHFLVGRPSPGLSVVQAWSAAGLRGSDSQDLRLEGVRVDDDALVETLSADGPPVDRTQPIWWPIMLASVHFGVAEAARAEALAFLDQRRDDGVEGLRSETPRLRGRLTSLELDVISGRAILDDAVRRVDELSPGEAAAVKLLVHRHASAVVDHAGQLIGSASMRLSSPVQRYYRDLRVLLHNPPGEETVHALLADHVLGPVQGGR